LSSPQRAYRAACPNCGAPVEFASAASASAVCSFCQSTLLRDGDALRRIGVVGELFDDHSPLQLGAAGRLNGQAFTLVGRLQIGYAGGTWNEWHALFDNGRSGWLSEDNGAYVFAFDAPLAEAPAFESLRAGQRVAVGGAAWDVASVTVAKLVSAQGELPRPPKLQGGFGVADLRNPLGEVATLDYASTPPGWSVGRSVALSELALTGLAGSSEKTLKGRSIECPSCGTALDVKLSTTQSLACPNCRAVVDLSGGVGAELAHHAQNNSGPGGLAPQIPLGRSGRLALGGAALDWQVVGYLERATTPSGGDDEVFYWREYLLWHREAGFVFLVDSEDGWSWVRPITGTPELRGEGARWKGDHYRRSERYGARNSWVLGEFYWRVKVDETAVVDDYVGVGPAVKKRLSREQTPDEVTWSAGETVAASEVAKAFGLAAPQALARDSAPLSSTSKGVPAVVILFIVFVVLVMLTSRCSSDDCDEVRATFGAQSNEYRQCLNNRSSGRSGGSYGGWSSGGGHK
jgi:hypothetical protein